MIILVTKMERIIVKVIIIIISVFLYSCMENKNIKIEYYSNGNKKAEHYYNKVGKDSLVYYYNYKGYVEKIDFYENDSIIYSKLLSEDEKIIEEGRFYNGHKIDKWSYYNKKGQKEKEFEYLNIQGEQYTNQGWYFDKKGDTIKELGNYYEYELNPSKIKQGEVFELIIKYKPLLVVNGDVRAMISPKIKENFDNIEDVKLDTIFFYKNQANLRISFKDKGKKNIRGYIDETYEVKEDSMNTRIVYIDIPIDVN